MCKSSYHCDYEHTMGIISAAVSGCIDVNPDKEFNLTGYEWKCSQNDKIGNIKKAEKLLYIVDDFKEDEDSGVGYGDIAERFIASNSSELEEFESACNFSQDFERLLEIRKGYVRNKGVDILTVIRASLDGIPEAIKELKFLGGTDKEFLSIVTDLCENSINGSLSKCIEYAL